MGGWVLCDQLGSYQWQGQWHNWSKLGQTGSDGKLICRSMNGQRLLPEMCRILNIHLQPLSCYKSCVWTALGTSRDYRTLTPIFLYEASVRIAIIKVIWCERNTWSFPFTCVAGWRDNSRLITAQNILGKQLSTNRLPNIITKGLTNVV